MTPALSPTDHRRQCVDSLFGLFQGDQTTNSCLLLHVTTARGRGQSLPKGGFMSIYNEWKEDQWMFWWMNVKCSCKRLRKCSHKRLCGRFYTLLASLYFCRNWRSILGDISLLKFSKCRNHRTWAFTILCHRHTQTHTHKTHYGFTLINHKKIQLTHAKTWPAALTEGEMYM